MSKMIAVSIQDFELYGCANCGCGTVRYIPFENLNAVSGTCVECDTSFVMLRNHVEVSPTGFKHSESEEVYYPVRQPHPRNGILKHEYVNPELKPQNGEYWAPRGVGYDLSGFVKSKEAGQRIVDMIYQIIEIKPKSWLDYREYEPNWIQVKINSEDGFDLNLLNELCEEDKIINEDKLKLALINKPSSLRWTIFVDDKKNKEYKYLSKKELVDFTKSSNLRMIPFADWNFLDLCEVIERELKRLDPINGEFVFRKIISSFDKKMGINEIELFLRNFIQKLNRALM